jgi:tetratricopeptide (TPR) repeat protein
MSKPTLVTVPFVLLLLDYWPLERVASEGRTSLQQWGYLILEKIPFLVFSAASSAITVVAQSAALVSISNLNLKQRIAHAPIAYVIYLLQTIFPADLAVFYPFSTAHISMTYAIPAMVFLAAVSVLFFFWRKQHPYLLVGWLWFLGVLFPMIGIVQVGPQSHADRYTYLAQIGLFVCAIWGITALVTKWNLSRPAVNLTALGVTAALTFASYSQTSVWQNSETLWKQALATTANSHVAENNFGKALLHQQRADEALLHFENAIRIYPNYPEANNNLGYVLAHQGNCSEAIVYYEIALKNEPTLAPAHNNLGFCLVQMGMIKEATKHFRAALQLDPRFVDAHLNLATALLQLGETDEAVTHFKEVLRLNPNDAQVREQLRALGVSE